MIETIIETIIETMIQTLGLALALAAGVLLGAIFFGGLWWTIQKGVSSKQPAFLFLASLVLRTSIVVSGFYFIGAGHWEKLLAGLVGFVAARAAVIRFTPAHLEPAVSHAP